MDKKFKESSKTGALAWLLQRVTAVILFVLLMMHFITYHFIRGGEFSYQGIVAKMQSPWFLMIQFLFLLTALYHGLNGVWMVSEDYIHNRFWRLAVFNLLLFGGLVLLFIGSLTIVKVGLNQ